jgi:hypothetical protein
MALGNTRAQVMELQTMLAGINQQMMAEQAMRRTEMQVCVCGSK